MRGDLISFTFISSKNVCSVGGPALGFLAMLEMVWCRVCPVQLPALLLLEGPGARCLTSHGDSREIKGRQACDPG